MQKCRQSSIVFEKPGILSGKFENFDEPQLSLSSIVFAETLRTFPTSQCLQKRVWDCFYFV